jgi:MipA family protein
MFSKCRIAAALAAVASGAACAQATPSYESVNLDEAAVNRGRAGGAIVSGRNYLGSDERRTLLLPVLEYRWANGWFAGIGNGVGYAFSPRPGTQLGARLTVDFGRKESRSAALRGMGDIDPHPEIGVFWNQSLFEGFFLTSSLRFGAGGSGALGDVGLGWTYAITSQTRLRAAASATLANSRYMQDYFGVTAQQAAASGYAEYHPGAGLRDVRGTVGVTHLFTPALALSASLGFSDLRGDARDSPLTRDATAPRGVLALTYSF